MDRGAWKAAVPGATRVGHNLAAKEREMELNAMILVFFNFEFQASFFSFFFHPHQEVH